MFDNMMLMTLIPIIVPLILSAVKRLIPKIPGWWLPILAPLLGAAVDMAGYYAGVQTLGPAWSAALGSAGVGLREIADQTNQRFRGTGNGKVVGLILFSLMLSGCAGTAQLIEALGKDPATACVSLTSIYGTMRIARSVATSGTVTCTQEGMTIKPAASP